MKYYCVTNADNSDWLGRNFKINEVLSEINSNYYFSMYCSPLVATFMAPGYEQTAEKIWEVNAEPLINLTHRLWTDSIKIIQEVEVPSLTKEQRIAFAILVAYQATNNPNFLKWALNYLSNKDKTQETIENVVAQLVNDCSSDKIPEEYNLVDNCFPALETCINNNYPLYASASGHKAAATGVDLQQAAEICISLNQEQIAELLGS